jgi:hypothetical protein
MSADPDRALLAASAALIMAGGRHLAAARRSGTR